MTFSCIIEGEVLWWYIDEQLTVSLVIQDSGIVHSYNESGLHVLSNLSIPAEINNNNTKVKCVGFGNATPVLAIMADGGTHQLLLTKIPTPGLQTKVKTLLLILNKNGRRTKILYYRLCCTCGTGYAGCRKSASPMFHCSSILCCSIPPPCINYPNI